MGGAIGAGAVDIGMFIVGRGVAGMGSGILACVGMSTDGELVSTLTLDSANVSS